MAAGIGSMTWWTWWWRRTANPILFVATEFGNHAVVCTAGRSLKTTTSTWHGPLPQAPSTSHAKCDPQSSPAFPNASRASQRRCSGLGPAQYDDLASRFVGLSAHHWQAVDRRPGGLSKIGPGLVLRAAGAGGLLLRVLLLLSGLQQPQSGGPCDSFGGD